MRIPCKSVPGLQKTYVVLLISTRNISRVERKTSVSQMVVFPQT